AITHYTVCLGGDCGDVTSTSFSVVIGSDGGVGAPFPSPLDPTAWPASISVVAVDATGASSSPPATFALDPSSFPTPPPTPPPSDTGTVTPDTGTTAGPPAS
ncbi:MAG TPA: hypothetical protein VFW74_09265, partial [Acidimicrobiia bacterium]|nr:hypothetical protein [Acidimicrobiia bacterium]